MGIMSAFIGTLFLSIGVTLLVITKKDDPNAKFYTTSGIVSLVLGILMLVWQLLKVYFYTTMLNNTGPTMNPVFEPTQNAVIEPAPQVSLVEQPNQTINLARRN